MKKLTLFCLFIISFMMNAQCTILGNSTINIQSEETYSVANEAAQCKDCHLWSTVGAETAIAGDNRQNSVKIKANSGGRKVLSVAYLTQQGIVQCSKNIDVVDHDKTSGISDSISIEPKTTVNCNIGINDYKEVKYAENIVSFFPIGADDGYKFVWTITYLDGKESISREKIPQFPFEKIIGIKVVKLKIISSHCIREFTKTYDDHYWKFF